ncbi:uncharacterized protein METZ01_LOCUS200781 [marine metagenome]|uniref:Uncharacterized protein n=1 Tax=marine metagenome TaxID=408172 RepID=A0A382EDG6_9ZZZZ
MHLPVSRRDENCIVARHCADYFWPLALVQKERDPLSCPDSCFDDCQARAGSLNIPHKTGKLIKLILWRFIVVRFSEVALPKLGDSKVLKIAADAGLGGVYAFVLQQAHQLGLALDGLALQDSQDGLLAPLAYF